MIASALLALVGLSVAPSDDVLLADAEAAFAEGVTHRDDSAVARGWFARAATGYDELWRRGYHTPELALNRARARRLAGDLPGAIAALHAGLKIARYSRPLQTELEDAREAVAFPVEGELAVQCRPRPDGGIGTRLSAADVTILAGGLWLAACLGVARFAMTRAAGWLVLAGVCLAGLGVLGTVWVRDLHQRERDAARPVVVVREPAVLRRGNAASWDPRLTPALPAGAEARELTRRGGWVQVELAGGAVGWLPETVIVDDVG